MREYFCEKNNFIQTFFQKNKNLKNLTKKLALQNLIKYTLLPNGAVEFPTVPIKMKCRFPQKLHEK